MDNVCIHRLGYQTVWRGWNRCAFTYCFPLVFVSIGTWHTGINKYEADCIILNWLYSIISEWGNTQRAFYQPDFTIKHSPRQETQQQVWQTSLQPTQMIPFRGYITLWSSKLFLCPVAKHNEDSKHARQHTDAVKTHAHTCRWTLLRPGTDTTDICLFYIPSIHTHMCAHTHTHTPFAWWTLIRMQS